MKTVTLELTEEPGGEVVLRVSGVTVADLYGVQDLASPLPSTLEEFRALAKRVEPYLVSWTLPGDCNAEGLEAIDFNLALAIVNGWLKGVAYAPLPLLRRSSDTDRSEAPPASPSP